MKKAWTGRKLLNIKSMVLGVTGLTAVAVSTAVILASVSGAPKANLGAPAQAVSAQGVGPCYLHPEFIDPATCVANTTKGLDAIRAKYPATAPTGTVAPSQAAIETIARQHEQAPVIAVTHSQAMTYGKAVIALGEQLGNAALDPSLPVWLVTVDSPPLDGSRAPGDTRTVQPRYTMIIDAANGAVIDYCGGCGGLSG